MDVTDALLTSATDPLINLAYEPLPQLLMFDDLINKIPSMYKVSAGICKAIKHTVDNEQRLTAHVRLDYRQQ